MGHAIVHGGKRPVVEVGEDEIVGSLTHDGEVCGGREDFERVMCFDLNGGVALSLGADVSNEVIPVRLYVLRMGELHMRPQPQVECAMRVGGAEALPPAAVRGR